ncbi:MAG: hydrolase [Planctomycetes bacterium]|nr:hydrolase [Planctomycetota bacterium]
MAIQQALDWLQQQTDSMADDLESLCNRNSGSDHREGLEDVANWLEDFFRPIPVPCQRIPLSNYRSLDDHGKWVENATGPALRWDWLGENSHLAKQKPLLLTIHYDTVYGPQNPFQKCVRLDGQRMNGPGVIDAKGGIVILRYAALAACQFLKDSPLRFSIVLTPDEEVGSPASTHLWRQIHSEFDFGLLFEPTMSDGSMVSTRKGTGNFIFKIVGRAAHAGRNFQAGRNAIVHAASLIRDLHQLNGQRENVTINIGRIRGGDAVNVVPDLAVLRVNVRVGDFEDQAWIEQQMQHIASRYDAPEAGYQVHVEGGIHSPPKPIDSQTEKWMRWVESEAQQLGQTIRWNASGGASDGNKLQALGLSNLDTLGPDGDGLHSDKEWVDLTSLRKKASIVVRLLDRYVADEFVNNSRTE